LAAPPEDWIAWVSDVSTRASRDTIRNSHGDWLTGDCIEISFRGTRPILRRFAAPTSEGLHLPRCMYKAQNLVGQPTNHAGLQLKARFGPDGQKSVLCQHRFSAEMEQEKRASAGRTAKDEASSIPA